MGDQHIWYSQQRARKGHFCDQCCNYIEKGNVYLRHVWITEGGRFIVMNEHVDPVCPPNFADIEAMEIMREERLALGVPMVFMAETSKVQLVAINGEVVTEDRTEYVLREAPPILRVEIQEDDIPF